MKKTRFPILNKLGEKHLNKIDNISDERHNDDGFFIYLKGYTNSEMDSLNPIHVIHEETPSECISQLKAAKICRCESCLTTHP